jgi:hypothetical protein
MSTICKNLGPADRIARLFLGMIALTFGLMACAIIEGTMIGVLAAVVGLALLAVAATAFCPLYFLLHIRTDSPASA